MTTSEPTLYAYQADTSPTISPAPLLPTFVTVAWVERVLAIADESRWLHPLTERRS